MTDNIYINNVQDLIKVILNILDAIEEHAHTDSYQSFINHEYILYSYRS